MSEDISTLKISSNENVSICDHFGNISNDTCIHCTSILVNSTVKVISVLVKNCIAAASEQYDYFELRIHFAFIYPKSSIVLRFL